MAPFTAKNDLSEKVWYFIDVYLINRTALTSEIFFNTRREISYLHAAK